MFRKYAFSAVLGAWAATIAFTLPAAAQTLPSGQQAATPIIPGETAQNAPVTLEGQKGIPLGGFRLFPTLELDASYDDNIYRTQSDTKSDYFFTETPGFDLQSQWSRHFVELFGNYSANQYMEHGTEDNNNGLIGGDGRLDVTRGLDLIGGGDYQVLHLARTSPDEPFNAKDPTRYTETVANAALEYHPYHFGFTIGGDFTRWVYDPTTLFGLPRLSNADRNEDLYLGYAKASYEFSPGYAAFFQAIINDAVYDLKLDRTGLDRANNGETYNVGVDMLVTDLVKGQLFVGYLDQRYKAPLVGISGFNYGGNVEWNPDPLWVVHFSASRTLNGTTIAGASAEDDQVVRLGADYSLRRSVKILTHIQYTDSEFNGSSRDDKYWDAGVGVEYAMNAHMSARLSYDYQTRNSTIGGQNFDDNTVTVGLNLHI